MLIGTVESMDDASRRSSVTARGPIVCAGPNLALERNQRLARLDPGAVQRTRDSLVYASGKGINVARTVVILGGSAVVVTFVPGPLGAIAVEMARAEGIDIDEVVMGGDVRSTALLLEDDGRTTVINDRGPSITPADWGRFRRTVARRLGGAAMLVCSGSLPADAPATAYAQLVTEARAAGVRSIVDATGDVLSEALAERPDLVMPNLFEAQAALHGLDREPAATDGAGIADQATTAAADLVGLGAGSAIVTAGAHGLAIASGDRAPIWLAAPQVDVVNTIGAGDALAGALALRWAAGASLSEAATEAAGVAAASVATRIPGHVDPRGFRDRAIRR